MNIFSIKQRQFKYSIAHVSRWTLFFFICVTAGVNCKKFVQIDPPDSSLVTASVYTSEAKATAAISGIYSGIMASYTGYAPGGTQSFTLLAGLSADELMNYSSNSSRNEFYKNALSSSNPTNYALWKITYQYIYQANAIIEGLTISNEIPESAKIKLSSEAKFVRAFLYFNLVNYWGDVPYINGTDYAQNTLAPRTPSAAVYGFIVADLLDAQAHLDADYPNSERVRPNKWAAASLLSRVYLFMQNWTAAETSASSVIAVSSLYTLPADVSEVFLKNSGETIWQLMPVVPGFNTPEAYNFILSAKPTNIALSDSLVTSFEAGDARMLNWIGSYSSGAGIWYYPYKYKIRTGDMISEYSTVLRLAEQYLIRAEARCMQNKLTGANSAESDVNTIRTRAGIGALSGLSKDQTLLAIEQERRHEFFTEWGHRWLDLKRTGRASTVLGAVKGSNWQSTDTLYPIPQKEILVDNQLSQNNGY